MKIGSLFSGIGGFDLAAKWMGWETEWFSEINPYACKTLNKNFPRFLNEVGYDAEWHCIPAFAVGAPHWRDRIWIIAYTRKTTQVYDTVRFGLHRNDRWQEFAEFTDGHWWESERGILRVANGTPNRLDRVKCLGLSVVPQVVYEIFTAIENTIKENQNV